LESVILVDANLGQFAALELLGRDFSNPKTPLKTPVFILTRRKTPTLMQAGIMNALLGHSMSRRLMPLH
jgi:hypothetical protein